MTTEEFCDQLIAAAAAHEASGGARDMAAALHQAAARIREMEFQLAFHPDKGRLDYLDGLDRDRRKEFRWQLDRRKAGMTVRYIIDDMKAG